MEASANPEPLAHDGREAQKGAQEDSALREEPALEHHAEVPRIDRAKLTKAILVQLVQRLLTSWYYMYW